MSHFYGYLKCHSSLSDVYVARQTHQMQLALPPPPCTNKSLMSRYQCFASWLVVSYKMRMPGADPGILKKGGILLKGGGGGAICIGNSQKEGSGPPPQIYP